MIRYRKIRMITMPCLLIMVMAVLGGCGNNVYDAVSYNNENGAENVGAKLKQAGGGVHITSVDKVIDMEIPEFYRTSIANNDNTVNLFSSTYIFKPNTNKVSSYSMAARNISTEEIENWKSMYMADVDIELTDATDADDSLRDIAYYNEVNDEYGLVGVTRCLEINNPEDGCNSYIRYTAFPGNIRLSQEDYDIVPDGVMNIKYESGDTSDYVLSNLATEKIELTQYAAKLQAMDVAKQLVGDDFSLSNQTSASIYLPSSQIVDDAGNAVYQDYRWVRGYDFYFGRYMNGLGYNYARGNDYSENEDGYSDNWHEEYFHIFISEDNISIVEYMNAGEITELITNQTKMLKFGQIKNVYEQMVITTHANLIRRQSINSEAPVKGQLCQINVEQVKLGYMMVVDTNDTKKAYLLPVWDFYKRYDVTDKDRYILSSLTINAVDGSIIDRNRGF